MKFDGFELSFEFLPRRRNATRRAAHPHLDHRDPDKSQLIAPARRCTLSSFAGGHRPVRDELRLRDELAVTEAGPSAVATFRVNARSTLAQVSSIATGQAAACRIVRAGDTLYASNAGSGTPTRIGSVTVPGAIGGESIVAG